MRMNASIQDITYYSSKRQHPFSYTSTLSPTPKYSSISKSKRKEKRQQPSTKKGLIFETLDSENIQTVNGLNKLRKDLKSRSKNISPNRRAAESREEKTLGSSPTGKIQLKQNQSKVKNRKNVGIMRQIIEAKIEQKKRNCIKKQVEEQKKTESQVQPSLQSAVRNCNENCPAINKNSRELYKIVAQKRDLSPKVLVRFAQYEHCKTLNKLKLKIEKYIKEHQKLPRAEEVVSPERLGEMESANKMVMKFEGWADHDLSRTHKHDPIKFANQEKRMKQDSCSKSLKWQAIVEEMIMEKDFSQKDPIKYQPRGIKQ